MSEKQKNFNENKTLHLLAYIPAFLIIFTLIYVGFFLYRSSHLPAAADGGFVDAYRGWGQILSGIGTMGLLGLALLKLPEEIRKARRGLEENIKESRDARAEARSQRKEDAAIDILDATYRVIGEGQAIDFLTNPVTYKGEGHSDLEEILNDGPRKSDFQKMVEFRQDKIKDEFSKLYDARLKAKIFFPGEVYLLVNEIYELISEIRSAALIISSTPEYQGRAKDLTDQYEKYFDYRGERKKKMRDLEARVFQILQSNT